MGQKKLGDVKEVIPATCLKSRSSETMGRDHRPRDRECHEKRKCWLMYGGVFRASEAVREEEKGYEKA